MIQAAGTKIEPCSVLEVTLGPAIEDEKAPDARPARTAAKEVRPNPPDRRRIENSFEARCNCGHFACHLAAERTTQPAFPRKGKRLFPLMHDLVGQQILKRAH